MFHNPLRMTAICTFIGIACAAGAQPAPAAAPQREVMIIALKYSNVEDTVRILDATFKAEKARPDVDLTLTADQRTNSLIISGRSAETLKSVVQTAAQLDKDAAAGEKAPQPQRLDVYEARLQKLEAELQQLLKEIKDLRALIKPAPAGKKE